MLIIVNLKELSADRLNKLARELGIELTGRNKARKIEEINSAGIDPKTLEDAFRKYARRCILCGRRGMLDHILWYCKDCDRYYCIKCARTTECGDSYGSRSEALIYCKEGHYLGKDWL